MVRGVTSRTWATACFSGDVLMEDESGRRDSVRTTDVSEDWTPRVQS